MKFYEDLYVGESLKEKKAKIIERLRKGKPQLSCYVITFTENPANQVEFFDSVLLTQKNYQRNNLLIVGIAGCYDEALQLIQKMTEDTYSENGNADIRTYLSERQKELEESKVGV